MKLSDTTADLLFKHAGTCQAERLSPQLINNSPLIDEKALDEHMVFFVDNTLPLFSIKGKN